MKMVDSYRRETLLKGDPFFQNFKKFESRTKNTFWCERIKTGLNRKNEKFWYSLGFAYALILDEIHPSWKRSLFTSPKFFDGLFETLAEK